MAREEGKDDLHPTQFLVPIITDRYTDLGILAMPAPIVPMIQ